MQDNRHLSGSTSASELGEQELGHLTTAALLGVANKLDPAITERTLEHWRARHLLPRLQRVAQDGLRPVWVYPAGAVDQLQALLRLRGLTRDLNVLRAALWFDGYPVPTSVARDSIAAFIWQIQEAIDRELAKRQATGNAAGGRSAAITEMAGELARKRGSGFPRHGRQTLNERSRAVALTMGLVLGEQGAVERLNEDAPAVERLLGLDAGRRFTVGDAGPWLTGPAAEGLLGFAEVGNLVTLREAVETAADEELEAARTNAKVLLVGFTIFSRFADAFFNTENVAGFGALVDLLDDPQAGIWLSALLVSMRRSSTFAESSQQVLDVLRTEMQPLFKQVQALADLPLDQRERLISTNLAGRPADQAAIRRVLGEFERPIRLAFSMQPLGLGGR